MIFGSKDHIQRIIVIQQQLFSRMSDDTPISGFYGPGAWWAWLITMGMAHGHLIKALWVSGHLADEWDYDLIGASYYIVVAAIDLMLKARAISQLGDTASASKLLPALVCAERVVSLGTGSSLFSIVISLSFGRSSGTRTAGIAVIPLMFTSPRVLPCMLTLRARAVGVDSRRLKGRNWNWNWSSIICRTWP
jgi:hypothetical protein